MERAFYCSGRGTSWRFAVENVASSLFISCVAVATGLTYSERQVISEYTRFTAFADKVFSSLQQYSAAVENADPIGLEFNVVLMIVFTRSPD